VELVLGSDGEVAALDGSLLLSRLAGARVRTVARARLMAQPDAELARVAEELRSAGRRPFVVPLGGSSARSIWGYVRCVDELSAQLPPGPFTIVHPSTSGGTGAGLLLGIALRGISARVIGVVVHGAAELDGVRARMRRFTDGQIADGAIELHDGSGRGYGVSSPEELRTIAAACAHEGLLLDPVYNAKAFHALAQLRLSGRVVYLHTGGLAGLFPYRDQLARELT
jgi:D-cysteine desulfhydrase